MNECIVAMDGRTLKTMNIEKGFSRKRHRCETFAATAEDLKGRRLTILIEGEELFIMKAQVPRVRKPLAAKLARNQLYSFIKDVNRVMFSFKILRCGNRMEMIAYCFNWIDIDLFKTMSMKNKIRSTCFVQEVLMEIISERHHDDNFIMMAQYEGRMYLVTSRCGSMVFNRVISSSSREELLEAADGEMTRVESQNGTIRQAMYLVNVRDDEIESRCKKACLVVKDTVEDEEICMWASRKSKLNFKTMRHFEEVEKRKDNAARNLVIGLFVSCMVASEAYVFQHAKHAEMKRQVKKLENSLKCQAGNERRSPSVELASNILSEGSISGSIDNIAIQGKEVEIVIKCEDEGEAKGKIRMIEAKMKNDVTSFSHEQGDLYKLKIEVK